MIRNRLKKERGVTLISLTIAVVILIILADVVVYNISDSLKGTNLKEMQNDIDNLKDKISSYYNQNGKIPAKIQYTNIEHLKQAGVISDKVDIGNFLVIDLSAIENLTLNKGEDYEKIKSLENPNTEKVNEYTDLYIINEISHNIFYVAGVTMNDKIYYTNYTAENIDTARVDLRYVNNVKIPEGFYYVSGTEDTGILIKSNDETQEYIWIQTKEKITEIPEEIEINQNEKEDFIQSVNAYNGYYRNITSNRVMYFALERWSPKYDEEGIYKDKNGDTAYIPQGFQVSKVPGENAIGDGLVVKDGNGNEWVWIKVPKSIYTTAKSSEDYTNIEKDMQTYTSDYRDNDYTDTWSSKDQHGFTTSEEYNNWKNSMLKSVYEKGGFYIGRYEVGTQTARTSDSNTLTDPIIQRDAYPYNYITCSNAQLKSKQLATEEYTSSLMFGIQWDLVLKYMEEKGSLQDGNKVTQTMLKADSLSWGNYSNSSFDMIRGKYTASPSVQNSWVTVNLSSNKNATKPNGSILLTTGVSNRNSILNIYDLAGNVNEWTLEFASSSNKLCVYRGGDCNDNADKDFASFHSGYDKTDNASAYIGFRVALW